MLPSNMRPNDREMPVFGDRRRGDLMIGPDIRMIGCLRGGRLADRK